jgi:protein TonB
MSSRFKLRPMTRDGKPVAGGTVRIPIQFALPMA